MFWCSTQLHSIWPRKLTKNRKTLQWYVNLRQTAYVQSFILPQGGKNLHGHCPWVRDKFHVWGCSIQLCVNKYKHCRVLISYDQTYCCVDDNEHKVSKVWCKWSKGKSMFWVLCIRKWQQPPINVSKTYKPSLYWTRLEFL